MDGISGTDSPKHDMSALPALTNLLAFATQTSVRVEDSTTAGARTFGFTCQSVFHRVRLANRTSGTREYRWTAADDSTPALANGAYCVRRTATTVRSAAGHVIQAQYTSSALRRGIVNRMERS